MKHLFAFVAVALSLSVSPVLSQTVLPDGECDESAQVAGVANTDPDCPAVVLPEGGLPVGEATNLAFIAPVVGAFFALGALGGSSTGSTTSTVSTN